MMYHMGLQYFINLTHEMKRDVMCNKILYERRMVNISSTLGTVYSYSDFGRGYPFWYLQTFRCVLVYIYISTFDNKQTVP
jgi:hypothetical protein